jgi:bacteriorhodopsin
VGYVPAIQDTLNFSSGAQQMLIFVTGYYGFWIGCWFGIGYYLFWVPQRYATALGKDVRRAHFVTAVWIWFLWMCYPVCWGISEGGNVIAPDSEFIFYGILDCLLIPLSSALLLWSHRNIDPARLGISMRDYDGPFFGQLTATYYEKNLATDTGATTVTNGSTNAATSTASTAA